MTYVRPISLLAAVVLSIGVLSTPGCGELIGSKAAAEPEVARFHERMVAREFEQIYASAADDFRKATAKESFLALMNAIARKLGPVKATRQVSWNARTFNFKTTSVLVYQTTFASGSGTETFTFRISDKKAELVGYNISSLDLMTK